MCVNVCANACVSVCKKKDSVCVCVCFRKSDGVCVCVQVRVCTSACVCVREREREMGHAKLMGMNEDRSPTAAF